MLLIAIAVVLLLVVLNGLFAMTELAVVSSRKSKLQARAERGDRGARAALKLSEEPTQFLSAVQVGIRPHPGQRTDGRVKRARDHHVRLELLEVLAEAAQ